MDNTELVLTQQMLKSTNHKLSAALDAADMTPWKWDLRTGLLSCNVSHDLYVTEEEVTHDGNLIIVPTSACFAKSAMKTANACGTPSSASPMAKRRKCARNIG